MASSNNNKWISTVIATGQRAFPNLYDFQIRHVNNTSLSIILATALNPRASSVNFGGDMSFEMVYNEALKQHFFKGSSRIKTVSVAFWESDDYAVIEAVKLYFNTIYDFDANCFLPGIPDSTITISIDKTKTGTFYDGKIQLEGCKPTNLSYPKYSWKDKEPIITNATFSFDSIKLVTPNSENNQKAGV